jgi:hypothetical protein
MHYEFSGGRWPPAHRHTHDGQVKVQQTDFPRKRDPSPVQQFFQRENGSWLAVRPSPEAGFSRS